MKVMIIYKDEAAAPFGLKVRDLDHLITILKFQSEEKGLEISGTLTIGKEADDEGEEADE